MMANDQTFTTCQREALRENASWRSFAGGATGLTGMKLVVGIVTNSLGILSEAGPSALDLVAAGITFWAVRVSGKPADRGTPTGTANLKTFPPWPRLSSCWDLRLDHLRGFPAAFLQTA